MVFLRRWETIGLRRLIYGSWRTLTLPLAIVLMTPGALGPSISQMTAIAALAPSLALVALLFAPQGPHAVIVDGPLLGLYTGKTVPDIYDLRAVAAIERRLERGDWIRKQVRFFLIFQDGRRIAIGHEYERYYSLVLTIQREFLYT